MVRFADLFSRCIQLESTNMFSNVFENCRVIDFDKISPF